MIVHAVLLSVYPLYSLVKTIVDALEGEVAGILFYGSISTIGAGAAAWAFLHFDRQTWGYLFFCLLTAGAIGIFFGVVTDLKALSQPTADHPAEDLWRGVQSFLLYVPTVMVMEEVAFRGALDSHAHHEGDRHGIWTAIYVGPDGDLPLDLVAALREPRGERHYARPLGRGPKRDRRHARATRVSPA
jgi:membrane protease YdiL (CAAX protease family)